MFVSELADLSPHVRKFLVRQVQLDRDRLLEHTKIEKNKDRKREKDGGRRMMNPGVWASGEASGNSNIS